MRTYLHCDGCQKVVTPEASFPTILQTRLCTRCALVGCIEYVHGAGIMEDERRLKAMIEKAPRQ